MQCLKLTRKVRCVDFEWQPLFCGEAHRNLPPIYGATAFLFKLNLNLECWYFFLSNFIECFFDNVKSKRDIFEFVLFLKLLLFEIRTTSECDWSNMYLFWENINVWLALIEWLMLLILLWVSFCVHRDIWPVHCGKIILWRIYYLSSLKRSILRRKGTRDIYFYCKADKKQYYHVVTRSSKLFNMNS